MKRFILSLATFSTLIVLDNKEVTPSNIPLSTQLQGTGWKGALIKDTFVAIVHEDINEIILPDSSISEVYVAGLAPESTTQLYIGTANHQLTADNQGLATLKLTQTSSLSFWQWLKSFLS